MREGSPQGPLCARVARVVVVALIAGLTISAPRVDTAAAAAPVEALLIGDSVLDGLAQGYSSAGRAELAARHSFILDAAGCRRLITTSCRIPPGSTPTNAITVLRARAGQYDRALVVAAGYDDPSSGPFGIGAALDVMLTEARAQGIQHVIWLTYREAGTAGNVARFRQSNAVLRSRTDPELTIADWASRSAGLPAGWFSSDGIHLGPQAAAAMGALIGDALDGLLPQRCTTGTWVGSAPATGPASAGVSVAGGVEVMPVPARLVDTRTMPGKLGAGMVLTVPVAGVGGVPPGAVAAVVSVTAVEPCADTFLTAFPCGGAPPLASMVDATALSIVANSGVVRLGGGSLCVYSLRPTDVVVDVSGWIDAIGLRTVPVAPSRLVDTRPGEPQTLPVPQKPLAAGGLLTVDLSSVPGAAGATAATVNVTAAAPLGSGFISVLPGPCAGAVLPPSTSNLDVTPGRDVAATATVALGAGQLCVFSSTPTDVVVDLQALHGTAGGPTSAVDPFRIVDTRNTQRIGQGQSLTVDLGAVVDAVVVNLTAVNPAGAGFLTLYPCGGAVPTASTLDVRAGSIVANRAVVSTGGTSRFCLYSSVETDAVIDVEGFVSHA
ncbi:MAG: hypothetical protein ACXV98_06920 [Ilumatobacteraceae bacterium]